MKNLENPQYITDYRSEYWQQWREYINSLQGIEEIDRDILHFDLMDSFAEAVERVDQFEAQQAQIEAERAEAKAHRIEQWERWSGETYSPTPDMA